MIQRTAQVYLKPGVYVIETDLTNKVRDDRTRLPDEDLPFGVYEENQGRMIYIHDICDLKGKSLQAAIDFCYNYPRPAYFEIFSEVKIRDMYTETIVETLYDVDLTGILQGIMDYFKRMYEILRT